MGAIYANIPEELLRHLRDVSGAKNFVETGTYLGVSTALASQIFTSVATIEAYQPLYEAAVLKFANTPNVKVLKGNSGVMLGQLVPELEGPAIFWLDAHWSGTGTAGEDYECPLLPEINAIVGQRSDDIILIDDARMFLAPPPPPHDPNAWPDLAAIALALGPDRKLMVHDDVIISVPADLAPRVVDFIRRAPLQTLDGNTEPSDVTSQVLLAAQRQSLTALRLHLGCGTILLEGYVNVDYPSANHNVMDVRPDVEADVTAMSMPAGSVDEIRLHHVFEHFSRVTAIGLLVRWYDWLKPGGLLVIETPDFEATARAALNSSGRDRTALIRHLEGDQAAPWAYHIGQWYPERFKRVLGALGYEKIKVETQATPWHSPPLHNVTVRAVKGRAEVTIEQRVAAAEMQLRESMVAEGEVPTWEVWRKQLGGFLAGNGSPSRNAENLTTPVATTYTLPPNLEKLLAGMLAEISGAPSITEIQSFNPDGRDQWVRVQLSRLPPGTRVLDVGAGSCPYRPDLAHCQYESHDFKQYDGYINPDRKEGLYGTIDHVSDILAIPVADQSFDAILCTEVLEHVPEPIGAVGEMARILRPGGRMIVTAPLSSGLHQEPFHFYGGYTPHWYRMVAERFGLSVVQITPNGGFLKHLAQECARVAWTMERHRDAHAGLADSVGLLFGEMLPRYLSKLEQSYFDPSFTVGYHVVLEKRD